MGQAIIGILVLWAIFGFIIPFISKISGVSYRQKNSFDRVTPETFDTIVKNSKKTINTGLLQLEKEKDKVSKQIKGNYKYLFDKVQKLNLNHSQPNITLKSFIEIRKNIEELKAEKELLFKNMAQPFIVRGVERKLNDLMIEHNEKFFPYTKGVNFMTYIDLLAQLKKIDKNEVPELIDKIGFENTINVYTVLNEIETSFLRQDISKPERKILRSIITQKIS
jgi:hypothetical protein